MAVAQGISIKFRSYPDTIPSLLRVLRLDEELKKHDRIILKPFLRGPSFPYTPVSFVEEVLKYCIANKKENAEIFIAEGSEETDTEDMFESYGYSHLSEKYSVGLIDLNNAEHEEIEGPTFLKFETIRYPKILRDSFVISLPVLSEDKETDIAASLSNMLGAFPGKYYKGFFSRSKNKIRNWPIKYSIHDILVCKMPDLAIMDASEKGVILAGKPLEIDKQAAKLMQKDWKEISHLKLAHERFVEEEKAKKLVI